MSTQRPNVKSSASSRPRQGQSTVTNPSHALDIAPIVQIVNASASGMQRLKDIRRQLDPDHEYIKDTTLWTFLKNYSENFILEEEKKDISQVTGHEKVWVRTVLGLCKDHCSRRKHRESKKCVGNCGALHVCRTFLLNSASACPFNTNKGGCMFGHSFYTKHNVALLRQHHLNCLEDYELQKLFRRRPSRTETTLPSVCIYYNKVDGKRCKNEKCKSLHLCSDFVKNRCEGDCDRNHSLLSKQVKHVFKLFALNDLGRADMILDDIRHFMTSRSNCVTAKRATLQKEKTDDSVDSDDDDSLSVTFSETGTEHDDSDSGSSTEEVTEAATARVGHHSEIHTVPATQDIQACGRCEELAKEINKMQLSISWLTSQVGTLTKLVQELQMKIMLNQSDK